MRKWFLFGLLFIVPFLIFAQVPEPPGDFNGFIEWFQAALATWAGAFAAILLLTEKIKRILNLKGGGAVILSWVLSIPVSLIGFYFNIGIFAGVEWYVALIYALSFSLSANLGYLAPFIKEGVRILIDWISTRKEAKINKSK